MTLKDLTQILSSLAPAVGPLCAFCIIEPCRLTAVLPELIGMYAEAEGITGVLPVNAAEALGLEPVGIFRQITLSVYSDLHAVGLLAVACTALAKADISVNVISAINHDHLYVPEARMEEAMAILQAVI